MTSKITNKMTKWRWFEVHPLDAHTQVFLLQEQKYIIIRTNIMGAF